MAENCNSRDEFLHALREDFNTPVRFNRYTEYENVMELLQALDQYWKKQYPQKYLTGNDPEWNLIVKLPLEDLYADPPGVRPVAKKAKQIEIISLCLRWTRLGNRPLPLPDNVNSRKLWAAMYPPIPTLDPVPFGSYPRKELDPTEVLGYEVAKSAEVRRLDDAGIVELLTNMWVLCLLSPDATLRQTVLTDLEEIGNQFVRDIKDYWSVLARVSAFLETRTEVKPGSKLAAILGDIAEAGKSNDVNLDSLGKIKEGELFLAIEEGTSPINPNVGWQRVSDVQVRPVREVYADYQRNMASPVPGNYMETAFVDLRPWIWCVAFGIGSFCAEESANAKRRKTAKAVAIIGTVLGVTGFVTAAVLSGGLSLVLLPELVAAFGVRSAVAVGIVGLLSVVSGVGIGNMLKSSSLITNLYTEFMVDVALNYDDKCGLKKYKRGLKTFFSGQPAEERSEKDRPLCDVEHVFLGVGMRHLQRMSESERRFYALTQKIHENRKRHQYSVGVLGQPDVGKSEFLRSGCGFDTNPGFGKPTVRLMQYMDASSISWFDFPGLDDVFGRNGTVLDFQVEADLANVMVLVWKAGLRAKSESLKDFLQKEKKPPIVVCYNMMDSHVDTLLVDYDPNSNISAFDFVRGKIDEFDQEMRRTYNLQNVRSIYTCFLRLPAVKDEILWHQLTYHYNIIDAGELNGVIRQAFFRT